MNDDDLVDALYEMSPRAFVRRASAIAAAERCLCERHDPCATCEGTQCPVRGCCDGPGACPWPRELYDRLEEMRD